MNKFKSLEEQFVKGLKETFNEVELFDLIPDGEGYYSFPEETAKYDYKIGPIGDTMSRMLILLSGGGIGQLIEAVNEGYDLDYSSCGLCLHFGPNNGVTFSVLFNGEEKQ